MIPQDTKLTVDVLCPTDPNLIADLTLNEVNISESILSPTIHASFKCEQTLEPFRNMDNFYAKPVVIIVKKPILKEMLGKEGINLGLVFYRLSNRKRKSDYTTETFELSACFPTLLADAKAWDKDSYIGTPSDIVKQIFNNVFNMTGENGNIEVEDSYPTISLTGDARHPFQIINNLAERALSIEKNSPTFLHYMTMQNTKGEDIPVHRFESVDGMIARGSINPATPFVYIFKNLPENNYENPFDIMSFSFPCDFDLVSDLLNGHDEGGNEFFNVTTIDPYNGKGSIFGEVFGEYGTAPFASLTNLDSAYKLDQNPTDVERFLLFRRPRMALLEQDKIALKMTIPFNPRLNAGRVITVKIQKNGEDLYGSGDYLIVNMTHSFRPKGISVTILDCVSNTVAAGVQ